MENVFHFPTHSKGVVQKKDRFFSKKGIETPFIWCYNKERSQFRKGMVRMVDQKNQGVEEKKIYRLQVEALELRIAPLTSNGQGSSHMSANGADHAHDPIIIGGGG
jgi:hypothetical protein